MNRRELIKGLVPLPVLGYFGWVFSRKLKRSGLRDTVPGAEFLDRTFIPKISNPGSQEIRIGIIGMGGRGHYLARALGFAHPDWIRSAQDRRQLNSHDMTFDFFMEQENLNVRITGICEVWDERADSGILVSQNAEGPGGSTPGLTPARRYMDYRELLASDEVDAVIIATPDHWHARMGIDAAAAGKPVYLEKPFAQTEKDANELARAIIDSGVVFQLGHQNHQVDTHIKARKMVDRGFLGHLNLIQGTFNRSRFPVVPENRNISEKNLDWEQWQGPAPSRVPISMDRFFNWSYFFDYSLGQFGQLFCHEFAAINQIAGIGIPSRAVSTGGNYAWYGDKYEVPNVFSVTCDYPEKELLLDFSLTMGNAMTRQRLFMGTEATMQVDAGLKLWPESRSERYAQFRLGPGEPLINFQGGNRLDAVSSASAPSFSSKGIHNMYIDGRVINTSHLHLIDWLNCIRNGGTPKCTVDLGFEEAMTIIMAAKSFRENRRVFWDPDAKKII